MVKKKKTVKRAKPIVRKVVRKKECSCSHCECNPCRGPSNKSKESKVAKLKRLANQRKVHALNKKKGFFGFFKRK